VKSGRVNRTECGVSLVSDYSREIARFNEFIKKSELLDISMVGRKFTWYKLKGSVKSRIGRILVSREWLDVWPNNKQFVFNRSIFDHCVLVLRVSSVDWGSKPFRSLDVWQRDGRFLAFVRSKWQNYEVYDEGLLVLKEKLKKVKTRYENLE